MQVGRKIVGGAAIMMLGVDKAVTKQVLSELTALPDLNNAKVIHLY
jgi:D-3-phosphoglycerate dehydrogenase